jgi:hypothetical protein
MDLMLLPLQKQGSYRWVNHPLHSILQQLPITPTKTITIQHSIEQLLLQQKEEQFTIR